MPTQHLVDPSLLVANSFNSNVLSPENENKLDESIRRFGMFKPVVVRELRDGTLEIIGGEHRAKAAVRIGLDKIPIISLGAIDDKTAKEISLADNARYGSDDLLALNEILESLDENSELTKFLPFSNIDLEAIMSSNIALDELDALSADDISNTSDASPTRPIRSERIVRFKLGLSDAERLTNLIENTQKALGFTKGDQLTNAGDALVHLLLGDEDL